MVKQWVRAVTAKENNVLPKSRNLLNSFIKYCYIHQDERFWQALRNWSGVSFLYASHLYKDDILTDEDISDTFYWNEKNEL